jgi:hypothetical protein
MVLAQLQNIRLQLQEKRMIPDGGYERTGKGKAFAALLADVAGLEFGSTRPMALLLIV